MARTIVNPNAAAEYFTTAGVAIGSTNQPDVLGGAVGGYSSNTGLFTNTVGLVGAGVGIAANIVRVAQTSGTDGAVTLAKPGGTFAYQALGNEIIIFGASTGVNGVVDNVLRSPASDLGTRSGYHNVKSVRTTKVTKAIRDNLWNQVSGDFTSALETSNDFSTFGTDENVISNPYSTNAELVYMHGALVPTTGSYAVKT